MAAPAAAAHDEALLTAALEALAGADRALTVCAKHLLGTGPAIAPEQLAAATGAVRQVLRAADALGKGGAK